MNAGKIFAMAVENWPAKVLSIALAITLFVFHRMSTLEERFFSVPLNIQHSGSLVPSSPYPRMIRINLRGESNNIYSIMESDIEVFIDMDNLELPGVYTVPVKWRNKSLAQGLEPVQITVDPMEITLSMDHRMSKLVPVAAVLRGQVEAGYIMTAYSLSPAEVVIEGPAGLITQVSEVFTEPIDLDGRRSAFSVTAAVLNRDPLMIIRGSGNSEFSATVSRIIPVRNIANVPIAITALMEGFSGRLEPPAASIRLEGESQGALDRFTPPPGFLGVDASEISEPGTYILRVEAANAENMIIRLEPGQVRLHVSRTEEGENP